MTTELLAESLSRRPLLIIGDVGVGKTTFLRHLMKIDAAEQFANAIGIHINLGSQGALAVDLHQFIVEEIERQLREDWTVDVDENRIVRATYHGELLRFARGIFGPIKHTEPAAFLEKEIAFLAQKVGNRPEHLRNVLEHISKGRMKQVVIFLDNADQRDFATQQKAFLVAQEFAARWPAMVFLTLRPETFHESMKAGGALSGYHPKAFTISPPRIDRVIEQRLRFALKITTSEIAVPRLSKVRVNLRSLAAIVRALLGTLQERDEIGELIDNLASGNVRLALDVVRAFFGSGHVNTEKIVTIFSKQASYTVPLHEFVRAVVYGDQVHYDPSRSYVANLFDLSAADTREHFLVPILIAELGGWKGPGSQAGFVETSRLYEVLQGLGYTVDQIDAAVARAHTHGLIEGSARRTPRPGLEMPPSIRTTSDGMYHVSRLCRMFAYVDAVVVDTPILDADVRNRIKDVELIAERIDRAGLFLDYLNTQWQKVSSDNLVFSWPKIESDLQADIARIRRVLAQVRDGAKTH